MPAEDNVTVGLTEPTHELLKRLKEDGVFAEMKDGYKFGIALSLAQGKVAPLGTKMKNTVFNVGSLDPDGMLRDLIVEFYPEATTAPYSMAERLAEAGIAELGQLHASGTLKFGDLLKTLAETTE